MNSHKNARLTLEGRKLLVERIAGLGLMPAAEAAGISPRTARKWLKRFQEGGVQGLLDRSSRPARTRKTLDAALHERIEQLRWAAAGFKDTLLRWKMKPEVVHGNEKAI